MIASIPPGTELKLYREPDNEHDEWAIAVYLGEDDKLCYVTRYKNEPIARLMDGGKRFVAFVDDPEERAASRGLTVEEWRERGRNKWRNKTSTPTEDLTLPYSIYMIELS